MSKVKVTIIYLTEPSYVVGLVEGLSNIDEIQVDLIGTDRTQVLENRFKNINVINMRKSQDDKASRVKKVARIIKFYFSLLKYVVITDSKVFHIHWANKFFWFDFTLLNLLYKVLGKKLIFTAHNIDQGMRDKQIRVAMFIYKIHYRLVDHIIVHNEYSKRILIERFYVPEDKISINKLGINKITRKTGLNRQRARQDLSLSSADKVILFFGGLNPYKGLEYLIEAFESLVQEDYKYRLIIAGKPRDSVYFQKINKMLEEKEIRNNYLTYFEFIPEEDVEKFFIAADCCVLPYRFIFQSGVHALSYAFGLPVIATDVGSFKDEDIIEGITGYVCNPNNSNDLEKTIKKYFSSELFKSLDTERNNIKIWAEKNYSWDSIGEKTFQIYKSIL